MTGKLVYSYLFLLIYTINSHDHTDKKLFVLIYKAFALSADIFYKYFYFFITTLLVDLKNYKLSSQQDEV